MTNTVNPPLSYQSIPIAPYGGTLPLLTGTGQSGSPGAYYAALSNGDMLLFSMFYPAFGFACLRIKQSGESCLYVSTSYKAAMTTSAPYLINTSAIQQINQTNFILNNGNGGVYYFVLPSYFSNGATYVVPDTYEFIARGIPFGTWTGNNNTAELVDQYGNPISSANVSAIYRNDWQGNQLLYPTARTNVQPYSNTFGVNYQSQPVTVTDNVADPAGGTTATEFSWSTNPTVWNLTNFYGTSVPAGTYVGMQIDLNLSGVPAGVGILTCYVGESTSQGGLLATFTTGASPSVSAGTLTPIGNGFYRWSVIFPVSATIPNLMWVWHGYSTSGSLVLVNRMITIPSQYSESVFNGSYIPTPSTAPVTLTDYTLSGTTVTFAQDPLATAKTTWYGTGVSAPDLVTPCGVGSLINSFYDAISGLAAYEFAQSFPDASNIYASIYEGSGSGAVPITAGYIGNFPNGSDGFNRTALALPPYIGNYSGMQNCFYYTNGGVGFQNVGGSGLPSQNVGFSQIRINNGATLSCGGNGTTESYVTTENSYTIPLGNYPLLQSGQPNLLILQESYNCGALDSGNACLIGIGSNDAVLGALAYNQNQVILFNFTGAPGLWMAGCFMIGDWMYVVGYEGHGSNPAQLLLYRGPIINFPSYLGPLPPAPLYNFARGVPINRSAPWIPTNRTPRIPL